MVKTNKYHVNVKQYFTNSYLAQLVIITLFVLFDAQLFVNFLGRNGLTQ